MRLDNRRGYLTELATPGAPITIAAGAVGWILTDVSSVCPGNGWAIVYCSGGGAGVRKTGSSLARTMVGWDTGYTMIVTINNGACELARSVANDNYYFFMGIVK